MRFFDLNKIKKLYFGYEDIAKVLGITPESAKVTASRYVTQGLLVRVKRNYYVIKDRWERIEKESLFSIANLIQTPSYISFMTALEYYQITTQMQRYFFESVAVKRTKEAKIDTIFFNYTKINEKLYYGFVKTDGFFIAVPEKALLDSLYLKSMGRYDFDSSSIDFNRFDRNILKNLVKKFPKRTRGILEQNDYFRTA